jgi:hypothetical protein
MSAHQRSGNSKLVLFVGYGSGSGSSRGGSISGYPAPIVDRDAVRCELVANAVRIGVVTRHARLLTVNQQSVDFRLVHPVDLVTFGLRLAAI